MRRRAHFTLFLYYKENKPHLFYVAYFYNFNGHRLFAQISIMPALLMDHGIIAFSCFTKCDSCPSLWRKNITRGDKIALSRVFWGNLPWILTKILYSVILVSIIDAIAMIPTLRKSWHKPYEENWRPIQWQISTSCYLFLPLSNISATTILYPLAIIVKHLYWLFCVSGAKMENRLVWSNSVQDDFYDF